MRVLNFGSLNLDYVYNVSHFVQPGETLSALSRSVKAGGKGLNQSVALARAGFPPFHAGCLGAGGSMLKSLLEENGVSTEYLLPVSEAQGHTVIQVSPDGENSILLFGGSNRCIPEGHIRRVIGDCSPGDWLILQNEINSLPLIVRLASEKGMHIVLNPSPYNEALRQVDFSVLDWLLVNEIEAFQITGETDPDMVWQKLRSKYGRLSLLLTLGKQGSIAWQAEGASVTTHREEALRVQAVDTTAAGDTYTGYFLAGLLKGMPLPACMNLATRAAAISVTRPGAAESIPWRKELEG